MIAATVLAAAAWMTAAGLRLDWASAAPPALGCASLAGLAAWYRIRRPDPRLEAALTGTAQLVAFCAAAACLSYAVAGTAGPLWDETLLSWDLALHLDWRAYLAFVDARPGLGLSYTVAYQSLMLQMIVATGLLGLTGRLQATHDFVMAVIVAGLVTILISAAMPAMAMFVHLGLTPTDFPQLRPAAAFVHVPAMSGLRDGTLRVISLDHVEGIITFPSFHAALAAIFIKAFWQVAGLRWPALALNLLLVAATPIDGGHYFVDVLAGLAVAVLAILAAARGRRADLASPCLHEPRRAVRRPLGAAAPGLGSTRRTEAVPES